jgi:hypothetical protein
MKSTDSKTLKQNAASKNSNVNEKVDSNRNIKNQKV